MGFTSTNRTSTLLTSDRSLEMILDVCYHDINGDGIDVIIASTTTAYKEWAIEVYELINDSFADVTDRFFNREETFGNDGRWLGIINIEEIENELFLIAQPYVSSKIFYKGGPGGLKNKRKGKDKTDSWFCDLL